MRLLAPAKVNWTLEVLRRRDDGYHEVRTVLQTIDLHDEVRIEPADALTLTAEGPHTPSEDDLALRAACLLAEAAGRPAAASISLTKCIPAAAGLGGGSADAAAVLRGLDRLWGLGFGQAQLAEIAAGVGSDVPFFIYGGTALGQGRGERIAALPDVPETCLLLLVPPLSLPEKTKRMYGALTPADFSDGSRSQALVRRIDEGGNIAGGWLHNAFQRVAYQTFPGLAAYRDALLAAGAQRVHLAGSGPALFALTSGEEEARRLQGRLRPPGGQRTGAQVFVARTLAAHEALRVQG